MQKHRIFAALTALILLPSAPGCSTSRQAQGATLEVDLSRSYAAEPLKRQGMEINPLSVTDCGVISVHYDLKGRGYYYLYDVNEKTFTEFPKERKEEPGYTGQLPDGRYIFLYNEAAGRKHGTYIYDNKKRCAEIFDKDLQLVESYALPDEMPEGLLHSLTLDHDGNWLFTAQKQEMDDSGVVVGYQNTGYYILNPDFTMKKELDLEGCIPSQFIIGNSGAVYALVEQNELGTVQLYRIDCETMTAEYLEHTIPANIRNVMSATGEYELYYCLDDYTKQENCIRGIYGVKPDGASELIVDFQNSDLPDTVWNCYGLQDGTFLAEHRDANSYESTLYHLTPRTEEEIANTELISLAGVNIPHTLLQEVCAFNQSQNTYRIVIKDYGREWAVEIPEGQITQVAANAWRSADLDFTPVVEQFKNDLLSGIVPDIICMDDIPYYMLSNKGLLTDLMPLLEADERFDESLYLPHILNGLKRGDKLERIGFAFTVDTIAAKTEFVGEKQGRSADEYIKMLQNVPEGMELFPLTNRDDLTRDYLVGSQSSFIDKGSMTCSFDSPAFVQLLELVSAFPTSDHLPTPGKEEYYAALEYGYNYSENHTLLYKQNLNMPIQYHDLHYSIFRKADITLVGYPESAGGNGGMYRMDYTIALTSQSARQAPVMDFILNELGKQRQSKICMENWNHCSLPIMREPLENAILAATRGYHGNGNLNEQELPVLTDYIENVRMYEELDPNVTAIIQEEAGKYFAMDCTADSAAKAIQSRVGLYLSEQK